MGIHLTNVRRVAPFSSLVTIASASLLVFLAAAVSARAQIPVGVPTEPREYPAREYYIAKAVYHEGEFLSSLKAFRSASRSGWRSTQGRWVDSICYHTMMGESLYQMGKLADALDQYTAALNLYLAYPTWLHRVRFPVVLEPDRRVPSDPITWGISKRQTVKGRFSEPYQLMRGRLDNENVIRQGGVIALPELMLVNVPEILRCTALAIQRRREIMGAACRYDPLTTQLAQTLGTRPAPPNHWSQAWISCLLGLAYSSQGNVAEAVNELQRSLQIGGRFDHPLTAIALIELGHLAQQKEQWDQAEGFYLEATYSAASFEEYGTVEEAFRRATIVHLLGGAASMFAPLQPATAWSRRASRFVEVSLLLDAAQNAIELNDTAGGVALLEEARRRMARTDLLISDAGARLNYLAALTNYQTGNLAAGDQAFATLMAYQKTASRRLFEIGLADRLFTTNVISNREALRLYADVLREPTVKDWAHDPVESLSVILTPPWAPLERWFKLSLSERDHERAFEIADQIRRRRFFASLPTGGRLLSLRWVLEAPNELLSDQARLQRQDLLVKSPAYGALVKQEETVRETLNTLPLVPDSDEDRQKQKAALEQWDAISRKKEQILRAMALRRWPADTVFPPPLQFDRLKTNLPNGQLVLSFLSITDGVYAMGFTRDSYSHWRVPPASRLRAGVAQLLRAIGQGDPNQPVDAEVLTRDDWKEMAAQFLAQLTNNMKPAVWEKYDELVVIPDGVLWYLPFEMLQIQEGDHRTPLIARVKIRYVPTVSLLNFDRRTINPLAPTGVVLGELFPAEDDEDERILEDLSKVLEAVEPLPSPLPGPSALIAALSPRLIVLTDLTPPNRGIYDWAPIPVARGGSHATLSHWMSLPWPGAEQLVLPGFHSPAESALKRGGTGEEMFLAACGLLASGSRTILLSRWRTGGRTTHDLVREFVQELPFSPASDAWQRAVLLLRDDRLVAEQEPRLRRDNLDVDLPADHPFFWGAYMLIDTSAPKKE